MGAIRTLRDAALGHTSVTLEARRHKGWEAWSLHRGPLELVLVPQVGGRIMGLIWRGRDLAFAQPEREGQVEDVLAVREVRKKKTEMGFPLWGGDKTWLAPQARWTDGAPFLDLDSGHYDLAIERAGPDAAVARMTSTVCRETGVQVIRTVTLLAETSEWTVSHRLVNPSPREVHWGLWGVSMLLRPGRVYLPTRAGSAYPEGVKTFDEEGESVRVRDEVVSHLGSLAVIGCRDGREFKFGVDAEEGWILGVLEVSGLGLVGYRKQVPVWVDRPYGHGCVAEVYNSDLYPYFEMETHSPLTRLGPGESFELEERHAVVDLERWPEREADVRGLAMLDRCR